MAKQKKRGYESSGLEDTYDQYSSYTAGITAAEREAARERISSGRITDDFDVSSSLRAYLDDTSSGTMQSIVRRRNSEQSFQSYIDRLNKFVNSAGSYSDTSSTFSPTNDLFRRQMQNVSHSSIISEADDLYDYFEEYASYNPDVDLSNILGLIDSTRKKVGATGETYVADRKGDMYDEYMASLGFEGAEDRSAYNSIYGMNDDEFSEYYTRGNYAYDTGSSGNDLKKAYDDAKFAYENYISRDTYNETEEDKTNNPDPIRARLEREYEAAKAAYEGASTDYSAKWARQRYSEQAQAGLAAEQQQQYDDIWSEYEGYSRDELLSTREDMTTRLSNAENAVSSAQSALDSYASVSTTDDQYKYYQSELEKVVAARDAIQSEYDRLNTIWDARYFSDMSAKYDTLKDNPDFAEKSVPSPTHGNTNERYMYVNNIDNYREGNRTTTLIADATRRLDRYDYMTDEQIATYNYIFNTAGADEADNYLQYIGYELDEQRSDAELAERRSAVEDGTTMGNVLRSAATTPESLAGGVPGFLDIAAQNARRNYGSEGLPVNYNTGIQQTGKNAQETRSTISQALNEYGTVDLGGLGGQKGLGDLYQLGTSIADSLASMAVLGPYATVLLAGNAAQQATYNAHERGADSNTATIFGLMSGINEGLFEYFSIDRLLNMTKASSLAEFIYNMLSQSLVEGTEEFNTTLANTWADELVMGDKSELNQMIEQLMASNPNMSREDAARQAWNKWGQDIAWDFIGGAVSGGVSVGVRSAPSYIADSIQNKRSVNAMNSLAQSDGMTPETRTAQAPEGFTSMLASDAVTGEAITLDTKSIKKSGSGEMTFDVNGSTVNLSEVKFQSPVAQSLYEQASQFPADTARNFIANYDGSASVQAYYTAYRTEHLMSSIGRSEEAADMPITTILNESAKYGAKARGVADTENAKYGTRSDVAMDADGNEFKITGIARMDGEDTTVYDSSRREIALKDIAFDDPSTEAVYNSALYFNDDGANAFVAGYDGNNKSMYINAARMYYNAGAAGADFSTVNNTSLYPTFGSISRTVLRSMYDAGRLQFHQDVEDAPTRGGVVKMYTRSLTKEQAESVGALHNVGVALHRTIAVVDSIDMKDADGKTVKKSAYNAMFDQKTNTYTIALDAMGQAYLHIAVHESIHDIAANSKDGYEMLKKTVLGWLDIKGKKLSDLIDTQRSINPGHSDDYYIEEIVANTVPVILTDEATAREFKERFITDEAHLNFFERLINSIRDFLQKAYNALKKHAEWSQMEVLENDMQALNDIRELYFIVLGDAVSVTKSANNDSITDEAIFSDSVDVATKNDARQERLAEHHLAEVSGVIVAENLAEAIQKEGIQPPETYGISPKKAVLFSVRTPADDEYFSAIDKYGEDSDEVREIVRKAAKAAMPNTKIVDDGYPLIVYHGSDKQFTVFDKAKGRTSMDIQGSFFSPWDLDARGYGANVRAFYLNITNPADESTGYKALRKFQGQNYAGKKARVLLESMGYDGVNNENEEYIAFYPEQIKSADPVTRDDNGNIIPLSERFNSENTDIRFSKNTPDAETLLSENSALREANELLKAQFKKTKGVVLNEDAIRKYARAILKDTSSSYELDKLTGELSQIFTAVANGADWNEFLDVGVSLASDILLESKGFDQESYDMDKAVRDYLRSSRIDIPAGLTAEINRVADNRLDYRRKLMGMVNIVKNGEGIDSWWNAAAEAFPMYFDGEIWNEGDQAVELFRIATSLKRANYYVNPYSQNIDEAALDLFIDMSDRFLSIPEVKTYADIHGEKIQKLKADIRAKIASERSKVKSEMNKRIDALKANNATYKRRLKQGNTKALQLMDRILKQQAQYEATVERLAKSEAKYQDAIERGKRNRAIKTIRRYADSLASTLRNPTDKKSIPEFMRKPLGDLLPKLMFESESPNKNVVKRNGRIKLKASISEWREMIRAVEMVLGAKPNPKDTINEDDFRYVSYMMLDEQMLDELHKVLDAISRIDVMYVSDLTLDELNSLKFVIRSLDHAINTINKTWRNAQYENVNELAGATIESLSELKSRTDNAEKMAKYFDRDMLTPDTFMHMFGSAGDSITDALLNGYKEYIAHIRETYEFQRDLMDGESVYDWAKKDVTINLSEAGEVTMTVPEAMSLYCLTRRKKALGHLVKNGFVVRNAKVTDRSKKVNGKYVSDNTRIVPFTESDVKAVRAALSDRQIEVADGIQKYMSTTESAWGNKTSMEMYLYRKFTEQFYFPMKISQFSLPDLSTETPANVMANFVRTQSFTKQALEGSGGALDVMDIFSTFSRHTSGMAAYAGLALPIEDVVRWYNYKRNGGNIVQEITRTFGVSGVRYLKNFLNEMNMQRMTNENEVTSIGDKLIDASKASAVAANFRVIIQQPTSYIRAATVIDFKHMVRATMVRNIGDNMSAAKSAQAHDELAYWKRISGFDVRRSQFAKDVIFEPETQEQKIRKSLMGWIRDTGGRLAGMADDLTWGYIWKAAQLQVIEDNPNIAIGSDEYYAAVSNVFNRAIVQTQVVETPFTKSYAMKNVNGIGKIAFAFQAENTAKYNMLARSIIDLSRAKTNEEKANAAKKAVTAAASVLLSAVINISVVTALDAFRKLYKKEDEDKEKSFGELYLEKSKELLSDEMFFSIPGIGFYLESIWTTIDNYFGGDKYSSDLMLGNIQNFIKALMKLIKYGEGKDEKYLSYRIIKMVETFGSTFGLPISGLRKTFEDINGILSLSLGVKFLSGDKPDPYDRITSAVLSNNTEEYGALVAKVQEGDATTATINTEIAKRFSENMNVMVSIYTIAKMRASGSLLDAEKAISGMAKSFNDTLGYDVAYQIISDMVSKATKSITNKSEYDPEIAKKEFEAAMYGTSESYEPNYSTEVKYALNAFVDGTGSMEDVNYSIENMRQDYIDSGKEVKEANSAIRSSLTSTVKQAYIDGDAETRAEIARMLLNIDLGASDYERDDFKEWLDKD